MLFLGLALLGEMVYSIKVERIKLLIIMEQRKNLEQQVQEAYLNGLEEEGRFVDLAKQRFAEGKSIEEVYREISLLRHPKRAKKKKNRSSNRGTIEKTRTLTKDESLLLRTLSAPLRKKAYAALMKGKKFQAVQLDMAKEIQKEKLIAIKRQEVEFTLDIILKIQNMAMDVPTAYFRIAMDFDVLGTPLDYELLGKMALVMLNTYNDEGVGKDYAKIRTFMFDKIDELFERGIIPHPMMFDFMMKGAWISDKTFMTLHVHAEELIRCGMGAKLLLPLQRMLEKRRLDDIPRRPFSKVEEHYFLSLINLFQRDLLK